MLFENNSAKIQKKLYLCAPLNMKNNEYQ